MNLGTPHLRVPGEGRWVEFNSDVDDIGILPTLGPGVFSGAGAVIPTSQSPR